MDIKSLRSQIERAINFNSAENQSNTPDFILAHYLTDCLLAFDKATNRRDGWHGNSTFRSDGPTQTEADDP